MQPQAPALDIIAAQEPGVVPVQDINMAEVPNQEDSRTSSSTNSPAPPEAEESDFFLGNNDSQSSLGVPNIQDMQVNDEACPAPIYSLPNEVLIQIFSKLSSQQDLLNIMLTCQRFARNTVDILWHRPSCTNWDKHAKICRTLSNYTPYFRYREFVKRLNLASLASPTSEVNDGSIVAFHNCSRLERLTLTNCKRLTDLGLIPLIENNPNLLSIDVSNASEVTENMILALANSCKKIQGLNVSNCKNITNQSLVTLARSCKYLKRVKLNECDQITDNTVMAFAQNCRNILEIDVFRCSNINDGPVTALLAEGKALRELRLAFCDRIGDGAFMGLPPNRVFDHLRILDLTSCSSLTDQAIIKIIDVAPRLRNLVLSKCRLITDAAVYAIAKLGRNLHFIHLGHCSNITDDAVKRLVTSCNRIRYIDLGCCTQLTDESVMRLATLPKLKRIGLVKCQSITDNSVLALATMGSRRKPYRDPHGNIIDYEQGYHASSLERVHFSYCTNLTIESIFKLLNSSPRLTHLSLTGVIPFLRDDLAPFIRAAPPEFNEHQRAMFCVFSGQGVARLRNHLNTCPGYEDMRQHAAPPQMHPTPAAFHQVPSDIMDDADGPEDDDDDIDGGGGVPIQAPGHPIVAPLVGPIPHWGGAIPIPPPPPPHPATAPATQNPHPLNPSIQNPTPPPPGQP